MPSAFPSDVSTSPLRGLVLYIEDHPANFELVETILAIHPGLRVVNAPTGAKGIAMARTERPDAILLDMRLPDMSGVDVVRELSREIADGNYKVILLTADPLNIDVLKAMSLGAALYLSKPIDVPAFEAALERALSPSAPRSKTPPAPEH